MKKIIVLLLVTFSFSHQEFHTQDITISVDNSMQNIDINTYVPLVSGYYTVEPLFWGSLVSSTSDYFGTSFTWIEADFWSEFGVSIQCDYDSNNNPICNDMVDGRATISAQNSILNIWWADDHSNETISFDLVLRISGILDMSQLDINDDSNIVHGYSLEKPYPNPFNPTTTISFSIPSYEFVSIKVYDLNGRLVTTLLEENLNPGRHNLTWSGKDYSSGQYFVKMKSENYSKTEIVTLVK